MIAHPILFVSGREDEIVPPVMMDSLFSACDSPKKEYLKMHGHHNSTWTTPGYFDKINLFLNKVNAAQTM